MRYMSGLVVLLLLLLSSSAIVLYSGNHATPSITVPIDSYRVIHTYPHDPYAFTEGLAYHDGWIIESTGLLGNSSIRRVNLTTGRVNRDQYLPDTVFGEGATVFGDQIAQLTETSGYGILYSVRDLAKEGTFPYSTDGWGLTYDGRSLVMSDGSSTLYFLDPVTFERIRTLNVTFLGKPLTHINELEYVNGEVYANIWPTYMIARISPETGKVTGWIDLSGILSPEEERQIGWSSITDMFGDTSIRFIQEPCPNGIAYDPAGDRLFVTGKLWPSLFQIEIVPG